MRKRILTCLFFALTFSFALMFTLAACGGPAPAAPSGEPAGAEVPPSDAQPAPPVVITPPIPGVPSPAGSQSPAPEVGSPVTVSPPPSGSPSQPEPSQAQPPKALTMAEAYRFALEGIFRDHLYPNGDEVDVPQDAQMEHNDFAVYDVDGDGRDELIYQNDDASMAGMITTVYSFDPETGRLYQELNAFVAMSFYDNGVVTVMASHNHGLAPFLEDFWPYALYQYDPGSDGYLMAAAVDAWDGEMYPQDHAGTPFPGDIDRDGDKMVYILTAPGQEVTATTVDGPEYQAWLDSYLVGASELELPWKTMTEENIRAVAP